jgi:microsomal dipeptidase-like Zn-dependent dipeptidase
MGVTGHFFKDARFTKIELDQRDYKKRKACDRVYWVPSFNHHLDIRFNPWTINLFDDDILKILESRGLIGLNLDQRILGVGEFPGEYMSPQEVRELELENRPLGEDTTISMPLEKYSEDYDPSLPISFDPNFQLTKGEVESEKNYTHRTNARHVDYLANNIIHIMKVGFRDEYNGKSKSKMNVCDAICIGSDFDGMTDPINLPKAEHGNQIDPENYVTAGKFGKLKTELKESLRKFMEKDEEIKTYKEFIPDNLLERVCVLNGWKFLDKNFQ